MQLADDRARNIPMAPPMVAVTASTNCFRMYPLSVLDDGEADPFLGSSVMDQHDIHDDVQAHDHRDSGNGMATRKDCSKYSRQVVIASGVTTPKVPLRAMMPAARIRNRASSTASLKF